MCNMVSQRRGKESLVLIPNPPRNDGECPAIVEHIEGGNDDHILRREVDTDIRHIIEASGELMDEVSRLYWKITWSERRSWLSLRREIQSTAGSMLDLTRWQAGRPTSKKTQTQGNQVDLSGGNMA
jgi:hypothetical protein